jgi:hypothetical protein
MKKAIDVFVDLENDQTRGEVKVEEFVRLLAFSTGP